ncbi:unnamed protein product [Prunus brigantina]
MSMFLESLARSGIPIPSLVPPRPPSPSNLTTRHLPLSTMPRPPSFISQTTTLILEHYSISFLFFITF